MQTIFDFGIFSAWLSVSCAVSLLPIALFVNAIGILSKAEGILTSDMGELLEIAESFFEGLHRSRD
eukprot:9054390-Pyramimonas_sp.AAC.1